MTAAVAAPRAFLRPTWAEIHLNSFRKNLRAFASRLSSGARLLVVLKANAYGHGAAELAKVAAETTGIPLAGFGVSSVEEGIALRAAGFRQPVLILGSLFPFESFETALKYNLTPTIASRSAANELARIAQKLKLRAGVHLKVDTGMGRIGTTPETAFAAMQEIAAHSSLMLEGVYTHFAQGDSKEDVHRQLDKFKSVEEAVRQLVPKALIHTANSAAALLFPETHFDLTRPGLALYGLSPAPQAEMADFSPVLAWKTRVVFLKKVQPGTAVSYGGTFRTQRTSWLATLPVGYADGYRRSLSNKGQVLIRGKRCPVAGRVTMDQIVVDVTDLPKAEVGDEAVLIGTQDGEKITAEEMAGWADTISYEIVCGISARVPRVAVA
jgi:alanine racemase